MSPYLLVQAQELAVAHPAVQHPVHVDVVGLQGERPLRASPCQLEEPQELPRMPGSPQEKAISLSTLPKVRVVQEV